jgi:hypothetical protein
LLTFPREALNCRLDERVGNANNSDTLTEYAQSTPAGESGQAVMASDRRRRSNGPVNSQATGPRGDETLESRRRIHGSAASPKM